MTLRLVCAAVLSFGFMVAFVPTATCAAGAAAPAAALVARMADDPRAPEAYSADVALHVKLRVFPYIGLTLHGTSTYRRPGTYRYILHGLPQLASKFSDLSYDLGDPSTWPLRYDITYAPQSTSEQPVLRLTTKKRGLVAYLDVVLDPTSGHVVKATWTRYDGGVIVLTQRFVSVETVDVVDQQHASIDIPHMRADIDAQYSGISVETPAVSADLPPR